MKINLEKFKNTLPYASELFGIYQPLLGWKSNLSRDWLSTGQSRVYSNLIRKGVGRVPQNLKVTGGFTPDAPFKIENLTLSLIPSHKLERIVAAAVDSIVARFLTAGISPEKILTDEEWKATLNPALIQTKLTETSRPVLDYVSNQEAPLDPAITAYLDKIKKEMRLTTEELRLDHHARLFAERVLQKEVAVAGYLNWLCENGRFSDLNNLFFKNARSPFADFLEKEDPLETFGNNGLQAVLSPLGLVHLFREYFFEFDTFLGPPVDHVWVSPGGALEIYTEKRFSKTTEREYEVTSESTFRSETTTRNQDELSTTIRNENENNTKFGIGGHVNYTISGTLEVGANTSLNLDNSRKDSREEIHKTLREQTQKVSMELRQTAKERLRITTVESAMHSSKNILKNSTKSLVSYELRQKMRQVGVQIQDIGTHLCWQVFVDQPGSDLGLSKLLHLAPKPEKIPAMQTQLIEDPKEIVDHNFQIDFPYERAGDSEGKDGRDETFTYGSDGESQGGGLNYGLRDTIVFQKSWPINPPSGYQVSHLAGFQHFHKGILSADVTLIDGNKQVQVTLKQVNFENQNSIKFNIKIVFAPTSEYISKIAEENKKKLDAISKEADERKRESYLDAARDRIRMAGEVKRRKFEDLREEERTSIYRVLISRLMKVGRDVYGSDPEYDHITSELIRAIFDVDKMLYFVAPDWWNPKSIASSQTLTPEKGDIRPEDEVSWATPEVNARKNNYYITEESAPAPLGASLGWILQLDGDNLRNAFLNSPWVKAIIPVRPGKEEAALNWLTLAKVEGSDGLDSEYESSDDKEIAEIRAELKIPADEKVTIRHAIKYLSIKIQDQHKANTTAKPSPFDPNKKVLPTEVVYEHGFHPLPGSFEVNTDPTKVFSQFLTVMPTDQVVPLPYKAEDHI